MKLLTAFYLQIDRQIENANAKIKYYLHIYINFNQENQAELLLSMKFVVNIAISKSTQLSLFIINKEYKL